MNYPLQNVSSGDEDTVDKGTLSSNNWPKHVLHGNKIEVFVAHICRSRDWNF